MSQAEELLNSIQEEGIAPIPNADDEPHIVINSDRTITVPDQLKKIAVQFDHNIETVTFDCPRYWDEHDLSAMVICINYMTPGGTLDSYPATDISVDETDDKLLHFNWTISSNVTQFVGALSFLVCAKKTDESGVEQLHWNSELCTSMTISKGMECETEIAQRNHDAITQILTRISTLETLGGISSPTQAVAIGIAKAENTVTITLDLDDGTTSTSVVTLDDDDKPLTVVTNGVECAVTWEGF